MRSKLDGRLLLAALLLLSPATRASFAVAGETRVDRRAAEMPLPDPYLDPTWPDEQLGIGQGDGEDTGDPGAPGNDVEEVPPLDEDEKQAGQRLLQALTGDAPADPAAPAVPAEGVAPDLAAPAPAPSVDEDEIAPGDDDRDAVEW